MKLLIFLFATVSIASCITIECEFKNDFIHDWGLRYSCRTKKYVVKGDERQIHNVTGDHLKTHANVNVTQYFARGLTIERFPKGLGNHFASLEVVRITLCNMRLMLKDDLENLENLKYLDLIGNKLEKLESNVFELTPNLKEVILNNNRIRFIGSKLVESLKNIELISFGGNVCVASQSRYSKEQLERLKTEINLKCGDISMADVMIRFDEMEAKLEVLMAKVEESLSKEIKV